MSRFLLSPGCFSLESVPLRDFMRDDEYRGVVAGLGDLGDALRYEAIDAGQVGEEMLLEPSRRRLVQADMEEHVPFPAFSSQRGRDFGSVTPFETRIKLSHARRTWPRGATWFARAQDRSIDVQILNYLAFLDRRASDPADIYPLARMPCRAVSISLFCLPGGRPLGLTNEGQIAGRSGSI